jgi:peptidoglycan/LPS O-acetylase OafA/YrhL
MGVDQEVRPQADLVTRRPRQRVFRKDIEGLRAVAILAVVLYHAHVSALPGGYVGWTSFS